MTHESQNINRHSPLANINLDQKSKFTYKEEINQKMNLDIKSLSSTTNILGINSKFAKSGIHSTQNINRKDSQIDILKKFSDYNEKSFSKILAKTDLFAEKSEPSISKRNSDIGNHKELKAKQNVRSKSITPFDSETNVYDSKFISNGILASQSLQNHSQILKPVVLDTQFSNDIKILGNPKNKFSFTNSKFYSNKVSNALTNQSLLSLNSPSVIHQRSAFADKITRGSDKNIKKTTRNRMTESTELHQLNELQFTNSGSLFKTGVYEYKRQKDDRLNKCNEKTDAILNEERNLETQIKSLCLENPSSLDSGSLLRTNKQLKKNLKPDSGIRVSNVYDKARTSDYNRGMSNSIVLNSDIQKILMDNQRIYNKAKQILKY
jgi:hypothetical protein